MSRARDTANQINRVNSSAADATAITVDSLENVGIGVVPKTWNVYDQALQIGDGAAIWTYQNAEAHYSVNSYYNSGNKYIGTGTALQYQQAGGSHSFKTATSGTADAAISWNSKVDIDSDGLKFNGDTAAANALDDYEEGTWTPTIVGSGGNPTVTYQADNGGSYTKIGRVVYYTGAVRWTALSGGSGTARIGNLPFTSAARTNGDNADSVGSARTSIWNGTSSNHPTVIGMVANNTTLNIVANDSTGTSATLQVGDLGTNCAFQFTCIAYV